MQAHTTNLLAQMQERMEAQTANLQAQMQAQQAQMQTQLINSIAQLATQLSSFENLQTVINKNNRRRSQNSNACGDKSLIPLFCEISGNLNFNNLPPINLFPLNTNVVNGWTTNSQLYMLQEFYGENFDGATVAERKISFFSFIGVNH